MMTSYVISATEAARHFSDLLNKVRYQGQSFDIKRGRETVARIVPATPGMKANELASFLKQLPRLDKEDKADFSKTVKTLRKNFKETRNPWA